MLCLARRPAWSPARCLLLLLLAASPLASPVGERGGRRLPSKARLLPPDEAPLHTEGRYIVSAAGERVKWACLNWYGAYSAKHVVGGLEVRNISAIVARTKELGFNCIRLCYSTQAHVEDPVIEDEAVSANPQFQGGKRFLEVFDSTVAEITAQGLMVIINNHNHKSGWCCHYSQDEGLWYTDEYPESEWIRSLVGMAERYKNNRLVVAIDLRNEVHDYQDTVLTWGDGDPKTDWAAAAARAGNEVLAVNPDVLIVVMALCFGMDLRPAREHAVSLSVSNRVVYQTHNYLEFQVWQAISQGFASWDSIRAGSFWGVVLSAACGGVLARAWWALGRPRPKGRTALVVAGSWWSALCLVAFAICMVFYTICARYCGYWANRDIWPACVAFLCAAPLGVAAAGWGFARERWCTGAAAPAPDGGEAAAVAPTMLGSRGGEAESGGADVSAGERTSLTPQSSSRGIVSRDIGLSLAGAGEQRRGLCAPGWASCRRARERLCDRRGAAKGEEAEPVPWDSGLCCGLQCFVLCAVLAVALAGLWIFSLMAPTYWLLSTHFDNSWGFALQEGYSYTAPVWMGEFGNMRRGEYWINFMRYLTERDLDFAYWALNGKKWTEGYIDTQSGDWNPLDEHKWTPEGYGIFDQDYDTVRSAWRLQDLQSLMDPPMWWPGIRPCDRDVMGSQCGG